MIVRVMAKQGESQFSPIGFLDDDAQKIGSYIHGVNVLGPTSELRNTIRQHNVKAVVVAIPSLNFKLLRNLYETAKESNVDTIKIVPRIYDLHKPEININTLEDISIEDILRRQIVNIDYEEIKRFIQNKVVLVTVAGGSIGSEIAKQVCSFQPERIVLFDIDETDLPHLLRRIPRLPSAHRVPREPGRTIRSPVRFSGRLSRVSRVSLDASCRSAGYSIPSE